MLHYFRIFVLSSLFFSVAQAADIGILVGMRSDSATANSGAAIDSKTGYMFGGVAYFDMTSELAFRSGASYTPRAYGVSGGEIKMTYLDIPAGVLWKFTDWGGAFVGANFGLNVASSCPTACQSVTSMATGFQLGMNFKFSPQMGVALYYESMGALVQTIDSAKSIAGHFQYTFN